jgi:hypothetical protein
MKEIKLIKLFIFHPFHLWFLPYFRERILDVWRKIIFLIGCFLFFQLADPKPRRKKMVRTDNPGEQQNRD